MDEARLVGLYRCLADAQRLRILQLLKQGPLCVCHLQAILGEGQVKMSKQLHYLRRYGLVAASRQGAWMIYRLQEPIAPLLLQNLEGARALGDVWAQVESDSQERVRVLAEYAANNSDCPKVVYRPVEEGACC